MEPATNPIWTEAVRTLEMKPEEARTEFERHAYDRLVELVSLIANGNRALDLLREQAKLAEQNLLKACGAYENIGDMLATYYVKRSQRAKDETTNEADPNDGQQPDSDTDTNDS